MNVALLLEFKKIHLITLIWTEVIILNIETIVRGHFSSMTFFEEHHWFFIVLNFALLKFEIKVTLIFYELTRLSTNDISITWTISKLKFFWMKFSKVKWQINTIYSMGISVSLFRVFARIWQCLRICKTKSNKNMKMEN